jgi:hypothetical protein
MLHGLEHPENNEVPRVQKEESPMSLVKCPECQRLCFSDSQACHSCSREFNPGELRAKLAAENKAFDRKCYGVFLILLLLVLIAAGYAVYQGPVMPRAPDSLAISKSQ